MPEKDLDNMSYKELQKLAKEKGINCKGMNADTIRVSIQNWAAMQLTNGTEATGAPDPDKDINSITLAQNIHNANKAPAEADKVFGAVNIGKHDIRAQKIVDDVNELFRRKMPAATARYDSNDECIQFRGGPKIAEDVTINQPEATIMKFAGFYCARVITNQGKYGGTA